MKHQVTVEALHVHAASLDRSLSPLKARAAVISKNPSPTAAEVSELAYIEKSIKSKNYESKAWVEREYGSIANAKALFDIEKEQATIRSYEAEGSDLLEAWIKKPSVLGHNDCSRLHKLIESQTDGSGYALGGNAPVPLDAAEQLVILDKAIPFVITHDWASVFKDHLDDSNTQFRLPFPHCCFEMRISGLVVMVLVTEPASVEEPIHMRLFANVIHDLWINFVPIKREAGDHFDFIHRQIVGICIALEAEVATYELVQASHKLNAKRIKSGKIPLKDYHVVSLARKHRAAHGAENGESGRTVRMHFRRGHWRHFEKSKTWIKWMLVGDPKLGFIDKHYKL